VTDFIEFPKIARLNRQCIVTEKIDGTNACICIGEDGSFRTGSRTRWITPEDDNFGFSRWAHEHREELMKLGPGTHYGEWWGSGIQRGYGLPKGEKRFSLFNTSRWSDDAVRPACCHVVPVLAVWSTLGPAVSDALETLRTKGSVAVPGFMRPEGIVVYHTASRQLFKVTLERDDEWKGKRREMTPEEREAQRRSFAYGNAVIDNPNVTREMVDAAAEKIAREE
jgi:hypothetical protein